MMRITNIMWKKRYKKVNVVIQINKICLKKEKRSNNAEWKKK